MTNPAQTPESPERARAEQFFLHRRHSRSGRRHEGEQQRAVAPLLDHAEVPAIADRGSALEILRGQDAGREQSLVPLRYERMAASPFAFLRGSAAVMASDLSTVARSGINVQLCGDAHLSNFGMFASPDRSLVFDLNDFDETLPGPFEWDVKRLAASIAVAAEALDLSARKGRKAARSAVAAYRETMRRLAELPTMDVWYARLDVDSLIDSTRKTALAKATKEASRKSRKSTSGRAAAKLTTSDDSGRRFRDEPPLLVRVPEAQRDATVADLIPVYSQYLSTLPPDRLALLARFSFTDIARKVVGVGSVGTRALVLLLESGDSEPLILQIKQAGASVLEPYLGSSRFAHGGQRVVLGQQAMQATGDPFLGWTTGSERTPFDFYVRQLKDMKGSIEPSLLDGESLQQYARLCGAVLARAHARTGDANRISGYLGEEDTFDNAVADFAAAYVEITNNDHHELAESLGGLLTSEAPAARKKE